MMSFQQYKKPKNDQKYEWTNHVVGKMLYYGISESLIKRVVRFPKRVEQGIAPGTTAGMIPYGSPVKSAKKSSHGRPPAGRQPYRGEVWVMWKEVQSEKRKAQNKKEESAVLPFSLNALRSRRIRVITAWRYPGVSPIGEPIPIPDEILAEIEQG